MRMNLKEFLLCLMGDWKEFDDQGYAYVKFQKQCINIGISKSEVDKISCDVLNNGINVMLSALHYWYIYIELTETPKLETWYKVYKNNPPKQEEIII